MGHLSQTTVDALLLGGMYALMAQGLALVWSVLRVVNLAHGEFVMIGAFCAWFAFTEFGLDPYLTAPLLAVLGGAVGWLLNRGLIAPLLSRHFLMTLLATFALSIVLQSAVKLWVGPGARIVEVPYITRSFDLLGVRVPLVMVINALVAVVVLTALWVFLHRTRTGRAMRAAADNHEACRVVGIRLRRIYGLALAGGIALTFVAGALLSSVKPIFPFMGPPLTLKVFVIVTLGGLGSMRGIVAASVLVALVESYIGAFVPEIGTGLGVAVAFVLLVIVLAVRRGGVGGAREVPA